MFVTVKVLYGTQGRRERKRMRESTILKYITSVQVQDIIILMKAVE
jgi:hypothetical protein